MRTPKQYVKDYMENMIDNGDIEAEEWGEPKYKTWKDFFQAARKGAYDWSEDLSFTGMNFKQEEKITKLRDKILKVPDSGFSQEKKIFNKRRKNV